MFPFGSAGGFTGHKLLERRQHVLDHLRREAGIDIYEKGARGDEVGVGKGTDDAMFDVGQSRVPQEVSAYKSSLLTQRQHLLPLRSRLGWLIQVS